MLIVRTAVQLLAYIKGHLLIAQQPGLITHPRSHQEKFSQLQLLHPTTNMSKLIAFLLVVACVVAMTAAFRGYGGYRGGYGGYRGGYGRGYGGYYGGGYGGYRGGYGGYRGYGGRYY